MMKTLQQEIFEALRGARVANFYLPRVREEYDDLATKIASARCENCKSFDAYSGYCNSSSRAMADNDFCWNFKGK